MKHLRVFARSAAVLALAAWPAHPQDARGPVLGWIADGQSAYAVLGVPGAAVIGPAMDPGEGILPGAASPRGNYLVAHKPSTAEAGLWMANGSFRNLPGVPAGADRIALSPEGTAAAFYYQAEHRILLAAGLPDTPSAPLEIGLDPGRPPLREIAVSDDGKLLLAVESIARGAAVATVMGASGEISRTALAHPVRAVAFASGSHDAVIAGGTEAVLLRGADAPRERLPLWADGLEAISAVAISADGRRVFLADRSSQKVAIVSLAAGGQTSLTLDCPCAPDRLARLNSESFYRLTDYAGGTLYFLDGTATPPRIVVASPAPEPDKQP
jgi:hypothetical protein